MEFVVLRWAICYMIARSQIVGDWGVGQVGCYYRVRVSES